MPKAKNTTGEKPLPRPTDMLLGPSETYDGKWLARSPRDAQSELKWNPGGGSCLTSLIKQKWTILIVFIVVLYSVVLGIS